jgi:hypothetical protein
VVKNCWELRNIKKWIFFIVRDALCAILPHDLIITTTLTKIIEQYDTQLSNNCIRMTIEPFGNINYQSRDKEWFGLVNNIAPNNKVELAISADDSIKDISDKIENINQFAIDYNAVMAILYELAYQKYKNSQWEKTLDEIKEMYFLTAVSLKEDNKTWWLVLEPDFKVKSIYNHFLRFTMIDRKIVWANFNIDNI